MATKARIDLEARDNATQVFNRVQRSMGDLDRRAASLSGGLAGITRSFNLTGLAGAGLATAFAASVKRTADYQDAMSKLAQRAGVTTEAISALAFAADLSDVSQQSLARALRTLGQEAESGGSKLRELGISVTDSAGRIKTSDQLLREVADRIASIEEPSRRSAVAVALLGDRVGPELLPLLANGAQGLDDMTGKAAQFGRVVTTEAGQAAEAFNDQLRQLQIRIDGLINRMGTPVIAAVNNFFGTFDRRELAGLSINMQRLKRDLDALEARRSNRFVNQEVLERNITETRAKFEEAKRIFREAYDAFEGRAARPVLPELPTENPEDPRQDRLQPTTRTLTAAQRYREQLQRQLEAMDELTVAEMLLRDISMGRLGTVTAAQRAELLAIAQSIDARRDMAQQEAEAEAERQAFIQARRQDAIEELESIHARNDAHQRFIETLLSNTPTERLEEQRRVMQLLADEFERGAISAEQFSEAAQTYLGTLAGEIERTRTLADDLGLTFTSAFEDAIAGGKGLSEVLKGVESDILRLVTRKLVTEPLGNFLTSSLGRLIPSFDGGGFTGSGARMGGLDGRGGYLAMLHPNETVLDHTKGQGSTAAVRPINVVNHFVLQGNPSRQTQVQLAAAVQKGLAAGSRNL